jgi:hypothetical protein
MDTSRWLLPNCCVETKAVPRTFAIIQRVENGLVFFLPARASIEMCLPLEQFLKEWTWQVAEGHR